MTRFRINEGINTETFEPVYFVQAYQKGPEQKRGKWIFCVKGGKVVTFGKKEEVEAFISEALGPSAGEND